MSLSPLAAGALAGVVALLIGWALSQRAVPARRVSEPMGNTRRHRVPAAADPPTSDADVADRPERSTPIRRPTGSSIPPGPRLRRSRNVRTAARASRRSTPVEQHLADWCVSVARSVRSGVSLAEAIATACDEVPALAAAFAPAMSAQRRGASLASALGHVRTDDDSVALVITVARTCARLGGPAAEPLDRAAGVMHARLAAHEERKVHSAQAQLSALVLTVIPFAVLTLLLVVDSTVRSAFSLTATWICVGIGLVLNLAGWRWMHRIIHSNGAPPRQRRPWHRGPTPAQRALPDGVELLVCCLHAGLTPPQLLDAVTEDVPSPLRPAFDAVQHRVHRGHRFSDALEELPKVIGHDAHSIADSIAAADRYGLPLAPVLERLAAEAVTARRRHDEIAARKLPIRLSFPLVITVLPAFVLVALAPAVIGALSTLSLP